MTLDEALARAAQRGHDMLTKPLRMVIGNGDGLEVALSFLCQNGGCWHEVVMLVGPLQIEGDALEEDCPNKGQWQREQEARVG